jgi:hypothetical protein
MMELNFTFFSAREQSSEYSRIFYAYGVEISRKEIISLQELTTKNMGGLLTPMCFLIRQW